MLNALQIVGKKIDEVKLTASGAGAAGIACLDLLVKLGLRRENVLVCDRDGLIYKGRFEDEDPEKLPYARDTDMRTLAEAVVGADIFLGVSVGGVLSKAMVSTHGQRGRSSWRWPTRTPKSCPKTRARRPRMPSLRPAGRIIPTRSTTSCVFRTFSAARWTLAPPASTTKCRWPACVRWPS